MKRFYKLSGITILFMSLTLISCNKDENKYSDYNCNVSNPAEELDWLKVCIEELELSDDELSQYDYYMTASYNGETVFYYGNCHPAINYVSFVLNCNGDSLGNTNDLYNELKDIKLLWKHEESKCNFNDQTELTHLTPVVLKQ